MEENIDTNSDSKQFVPAAPDFGRRYGAPYNAHKIVPELFERRKSTWHEQSLTRLELLERVCGERLQDIAHSDAAALSILWFEVKAVLSGKQAGLCCST